MLSRYVASQAKQHGFFLLGLGLGLWLSLVALPLEEPPAAPPCAAPPPSSPAEDEYAPRREELPAAPPPAAKQLQRPRYYSTELGIRQRLVAGILTSEAALAGVAGALNRTAGPLQPRLFVAAAAAAPPRPRVVGFTDTRHLLQPFHALKYLADNYLDEYDFFFLVSDVMYVNARRLSRLAAGLSASQDVYMGAPAEPGSQYCSLAGGILLSNSVLAALHGSLEWCVRNSYSAQHHENLGRCVMHAIGTPCTNSLQGQEYISAVYDPSAAGRGLRPGLREAVTAGPVAGAAAVHQLHAYISRLHLEHDRAAVWSLSAGVAASLPRHPPSLAPAPPAPAGLRREPGMAPPPPENRFDQLTWRRFNASHQLGADERAAAPLRGAAKEAVELVLRHVRAWWAARGAAGELLEAAWCWAPPTGLAYRLLLRVQGAGGQRQLRQLQVTRALGAARLVSVPYVTESGRVTLLLAARGRGAGDVTRAVRRYVAAGGGSKLQLILSVSPGVSSDPGVRAALTAAGAAGAGAEVSEGAAGGAGGALAAAAGRGARGALLLIMHPDLEYGEDFLNRVRMNTIQGVQWFLPAPFRRYAIYDHPSWAGGDKPQINTGRFRTSGPPLALAVYNSDLEAALAAYPPSSSEESSEDEMQHLAEALTRLQALHCLRAPEPGALLPPRGRAGAGAGGAGEGAGADLGARHSLAKLLLEERDRAAGGRGKG